MGGVFGQHFFIDIYLIKQYRHFLFTYFCIYPFNVMISRQNWLINLPKLIGSQVLSAQSWAIIRGGCI